MRNLFQRRVVIGCFVLTTGLFVTMSSVAAPQDRLAECTSSVSDVADLFSCLLKGQFPSPHCQKNDQPVLAAPLAKSPTLDFGARTQYGALNRGTVFSGNPGALVRSPLSGLVVFAGEWSSYRELILIDACDFHAILVGARPEFVTRGQYVHAGDVIARIDLEETAPRIYLEFRRGGKPINPSPYWQQK